MSEEQPEVGDTIIVSSRRTYPLGFMLSEDQLGKITDITGAGDTANYAAKLTHHGDYPIDDLTRNEFRVEEPPTD